MLFRFQKTGGHLPIDQGRGGVAERPPERDPHPRRRQAPEHDGRPLRVAVDRHRDGDQHPQRHAGGEGQGAGAQGPRAASPAPRPPRHRRPGRGAR